MLLKDPSSTAWHSLILAAILCAGGCGPATPDSPPPAKKAPEAADLVQAVSAGSLEQVRSILNEAPALARSAGKHGETPLHLAARDGRMEIAQVLLENGADLNARSYQQRTPLVLAIENARPDLALAFIGRGADLKIGTPLLFAAKAGNKEVVAALLAKGADVSAPLEGRPGGKTAMWEAANKEIAQQLFDAGADVNGSSLRVDSPMGAAAERGNRELVEWFLANGADRDPAIVRAIFQKALKNGKMEIVALLVKEETIDPVIRTQLAAQLGDRPLVELCLAKVTNPNDFHLVEALLTAAGEGHREVVEVLVKKGIKDASGTALVRATVTGHKEVVAYLLDTGGNVKGGWDNFTLLHLAGNREVAELLLARGADLDAKRWCGRTPLFCAVENNRKEVAEFLIKKGANVNVIIKTDGSPLVVAARKSLTDMAKLLIEHGANVNAKDHLDATALHYAAANDNPDLAALLLGKGADPDAPLNSKATAATYRSGAPPNPFGGAAAQGRTPASLAKSQEMQELFKRYAKQP